MKLKGKCKADFEKWFNKLFKENYTQTDLQTFYYFPLAMKYGVYVDYFDSVGIKSDAYAYFEFYKTHTLKDLFNTREEAQTKAINKANEIRNEQL